MKLKNLPAETVLEEFRDKKTGNMEYRLDKYGNKLSILGYGCMRFTQTPLGVDMKKTEKEILAAVESGINYFDTAYIYPGSESALGEIVEKNNLRDKIHIATKLPHYMLKKHEDFDKFFNEELKRLRTDYVDYYLMHMLTDVITWQRLIDMGLLEWLEEKKKSGVIRQLGFSYHGNSDMFCNLLDAYDWDFCMIQYNYLDETSQAGINGLKYANAKGIPVMIMEPLRGGKLANKMPAGAVKIFNKYPVKRSPAEWAFRWLWNQSEVTVVLSGMNSMEMLNENVRVASEVKAGEFTENEAALFKEVIAEINKKTKIGCTGCRYCMPCPKGVDIPGIFAAYNRRYSDSRLQGLIEYAMCTSIRNKYTGAANCINCGKCEQHCPQAIEIRKELATAKKAFEGPVYKVGVKILKKIMKV